MKRDDTGLVFFILVHAVSVLAFQYTSYAWILAIPMSLSGLGLVLFIFIVAGLFSGIVESFESQKSNSLLFIAQVAASLTIYEVYKLGYELAAGALFLVIACNVVTAILNEVKKI